MLHAAAKLINCNEESKLISRWRRRRHIPWLIVSSPSKPESCYLYDMIQQSITREIHLPDIAYHRASSVPRKASSSPSTPMPKSTPPIPSPGLCRLSSSSSSSWIALHAPIDRFHDIVFHKDRLHAINVDGTLAIFNDDHLNCNAVTPGRERRRDLVVESNGQRYRMSLVESPARWRGLVPSV